MVTEATRRRGSQVDCLRLRDPPRHPETPQPGCRGALRAAVGGARETYQAKGRGGEGNGEGRGEPRGGAHSQRLACPQAHGKGPTAMPSTWPTPPPPSSLPPSDRASRVRGRGSSLPLQRASGA